MDEKSRKVHKTALIPNCPFVCSGEDNDHFFPPLNLFDLTFYQNSRTNENQSIVLAFIFFPPSSSRRPKTCRFYPALTNKSDNFFQKSHLRRFRVERKISVRLVKIFFDRLRNVHITMVFAALSTAN